MEDMPARRPLYAAIDPYRSWRLKVSSLHELYVEECGNPKGAPVVALHGGPGGGTSPMMRRYFDPQRYRVILFDQRGCGRSTPHAELRENTTWHLVEDMERIRKHLGINSWMLFGGSWGSTLALIYAQAFPERVSAMILRAIFTITGAELDWFYHGGAAHFWPELYEAFLEPIPEAERNDLIAAYYKRLTGVDKEEQLRCARAWSRWEGSTLSLMPSHDRIQAMGFDRYALAFARIEAHYFLNRGFLSEEQQILPNMPKLRGIPALLVQGRYDVITPPITAYKVHQALPGSELTIIPDAGHAVSEPGITAALLDGTDRFSRL